VRSLHQLPGPLRALANKGVSPMNTAIDLNRKLYFHEGGLSDANAADAFSKLELGVGKERTWNEALKHRVTLLVGQANTGKSTELDLLGQRLLAEGRQMFAFRLRDLHTAGPSGQDELLPGPAQATLERWRESEDEAVILLDSVDEAELIDPQAFFRCLKRVVKLVRGENLGRARWVISTRPSAWFSTSVIATIRDELSPHTLRVAEAGTAEKSTVALAMGEGEPLDLVLCALRPLSTRQAATLLKKVFEVELDTRAAELVANLGLSFAMSSPGNLKWLSRIIKASESPSSRHQAYELAARQLATPRNDDMFGSQDELLSEIKSLSAAGVLCESWLFSFREAETTTGSLPLSELLSHRDIRFERLLRAVPLTGDAGLQMVKFIPAHLQVFLAAEWLCGRAKTSADQHALAMLFTRESLAGPLVPVHLMVCAGWMANKLPEFRTRLLEFAPQVVLFLGDMAEIPPDEGKHALERTMQMLSAGHPLFHNGLTLTGDDYWHVGRPELHPALCSAFERYFDNDMCTRYLLYVMSYRRIDGVVPLLHRYLLSARPTRLHRLCLEALEICGDQTDLERAASHLVSTGVSEPELLRVLVCALIRKGAAASWVVKLCRELRDDGISVKHYIADAAAEAPVSIALEYASSLLLSEEQEGASPALADGLDDDELAPVAIAVSVAIIRGVLSREQLDVKQLGEVISLLERVRTMPSTVAGYGRFTDLSEVTAKHAQFKELALKMLSSALKPDEAYLLLDGERWVYVALTADDADLVARVLRTAPDSRQKELLERVREYLWPPEAQVRLTPPTRSSGRSMPPDVPDAFIKQLEKQRTQVGACEDAKLVTRALGIVGRRLSEPFSAEKWNAASQHHGEPLLEALKQGVKTLWRKHEPMFDKDDPRSLYFQTMAGLQGLHLELELEGNLGAVTEDEASRAFAYALHTLNSVPQWVAPLASRFPAAFSRHCEQTVSCWRDSATEQELAAKLVDRLTRRADLPPPNAVLLNGIWGMVKEGAWDAVSSGRARAVEMLCKLAPQFNDELSQFVLGQVASAWTDESADSFGWWVSLWLRLSSSEAVAWLEAQPRDSESKLSMLFSLGHDLIRRDSGTLLSLALNKQEQCNLLSRLYLLFVAIAPHGTDVRYVGVHSPTNRDETGRFRDSLLSRIATIGGAAAYDVLFALATRAGVSEPEMRWMHSLALTVADVAAKGHAWTVCEFRKYAEATDLSELPLRDGENFWKAVQLDVEEVVRNLHEGAFSPRKLLLQTDEKGMQLWLSRELQLLSQGRYRVQREAELADGTTPDLTAHGPAKPVVTLELKLGEGRSEKSLLSDLELQLHDDYLRDQDSIYGMFVVMWKAKDTSIAQTRLDKKIEKVRTALERRAENLNRAAKGRKHVKVVCFQCPRPVSKRHQNQPKKKGG
jgi:hypothetical protein